MYCHLVYHCYFVICYFLIQTLGSGFIHYVNRQIYEVWIHRTYSFIEYAYRSFLDVIFGYSIDWICEWSL